MLAYAATIFLSAFLLFQVQPLIARFILPWFGGSAAVWSAALLFFQLILLAGYLYAHCLIRYVKASRQAWVHTALLAASVATLPIIPASRWKPSASGDPTWQIMLLLSATVGLPYLRARMVTSFPDSPLEIRPESTRLPPKRTSVAGAERETDIGR